MYDFRYCKIWIFSIEPKSHVKSAWKSEDIFTIWGNQLWAISHHPSIIFLKRMTSAMSHPIILPHWGSLWPILKRFPDGTTSFHGGEWWWQSWEIRKLGDQWNDSKSDPWSNSSKWLMIFNGCTVPQDFFGPNRYPKTIPTYLVTPTYPNRYPP